ncbi:DUF3955 domain-containing protein [Vibrio natriegens]|uniref:DUF3955 domain-containing protein n=1 Tax=Vibrio natriegens TaxID=691 RepID=UPI0021E85D43|nr:DUF3955 domain-containing protein [Vibrio natriegens]UYI46227.1 DUF3955 domain-containing protein [Vibrio natriegens]
MKLLAAYRLSGFLSLLGILSLVAYYSIGAHVDEQGVLVEPFALIPIFWMLQLLAGVTFVVTYLKRSKKAH